MLSTAASPKDVYLNFSKAGFLHVDVFVYGAVFQIPSFLGLVALFQRDCHRFLMEREMKRLHKDSLPGGAPAFSVAPFTKLCMGFGAADAKAGSEQVNFPMGPRRSAWWRASFTGKLKSQLVVSFPKDACVVSIMVKPRSRGFPGTPGIPTVYDSRLKSC